MAKGNGIARIEWTVMFLISVCLIGVSLSHLGSLSLTEVFGFISGGVCVWLVVREHLWNWPVGLINNLVFFVLFASSRLYADMGLQVIYFALGIYGWWNWLHGGAERKALSITKTTRKEWISISLAIPFFTWGLRESLIYFNGAAPFWDSLTTVLSLVAQYLLTWKRIENWFFWILADLIYVPLYFSRALPLTATLYGIFLILCVIGFLEWRRGDRSFERKAS